VWTAADTLPLFYAICLAPERAVPNSDSMPGRDFRMYNPARRPSIDWGTLGNLGSAARPMLFEVQPRLGFDPGIHTFDLYHVQPEDLRFFRHARSYSEAFFSQGKNQFESMLSSRFSRTFAGGTNFSLEYNTINNLGQYRYQRNKHNTLTMGVWVPIGERYQLFVIYAHNVNRQQENGGIVTDTVFGKGNFSGPVAAPVRLANLTAYSRLDDQRFHITQHLNFTRTADSVAHRVFRATHTFNWISQTFKYADTGPNGVSADTSYYNQFLVDYRGIRNYINLSRLDNALTLATFKERKTGRPSDMLAVGISHSYIKLHQEPKDSTLSNFFLTGNLSITPSDAFGLTASGRFGLFANFGEYQASGELSVSLGPAGRLKVNLLSQRYPPDLLHTRLFVSQREIWNNNFQKPVENMLSATYALPLVGLEVTGRTQLLNNYLYFDQNSNPAQIGSPVQIAQLIVRENIRVWKIHLDNTFALQKANQTSVLRLPTWFSENSLYFSGKIFHKRMDMSVGIDFRMNNTFTPDGYQPLLWSFHLQDEVSQKPYPWADVFLAFKIQAFRFFARYENLYGTTLFDNKKVFYQTAWYPQPFSSLRIGISWRFMDFNTSLPGEKTAPTRGNSSGRPKF
jgi:hypothetical protein